MTKPYSSVIICTYNRAKSLKRTIQSLANQSLSSDDFEIIVIDDGSSDSTLELCNKMKKDIPNLNVISTSKKMALGSVRNMGAQHSKGDSLFFTDDDCIADKYWVETMCAATQKHPIVAGGVDSNKDVFFQLCHNISQFHAFMPDNVIRKKEFIAGANMGFREAVFKELGGFEKGRSLAEDMEIAIRAGLKGYSVFFEPKAKVTHNPNRTTLIDIFYYSYSHAKMTILLRRDYKDFLRTPIILRSPFLVLLFSPVIALKVLMGTFLHNKKLLKYFHTIPVLYALKLGWCLGAARGLRKPAVWNNDRTI